MITALAFAILAVLVALFAWAAVKAYRALYRPARDPLEWEEVYHIPEFKPRVRTTILNRERKFDL
jgi:hypothetical protein